MQSSLNKGGGGRKLVDLCFELTQSLKIISGLKETCIKRYIVERTNNAEVRLE